MSLDESIYREFLEEVERAAEQIRGLIDEDRSFVVFCHNDADGLSSGAIASIMFLREGARFSTRSVGGIDDILEGLKDFSGAFVPVFTDIGSGYLDEIVKVTGDSPVVILDHHEPVGEASKNIIQVNPHLCGINGADEISGAGVTYLVAKTLNEENVSYSPVAVVGALGDLQDRADGRSLHGLNELIVKDSINAGLMKVEEDLLFYGRSYKPIHIALASTTNPFIPGISGDESRAYSFLMDVGIKVKEGDKWKVLAELDEDEKKKLYNGLMKHLASLGLPPSLAQSIIGKVYELVKEEPWTYLRDAREFASLLNACGKTGNDWIGIAVAMGNRGELLEKAQELLEDYRVKLARAIEYAMRDESKQELKHTVVIDGGDVIDHKLISSVASMISSTGIMGEDKVLIAMASAEGSIKVSARASKKLIKMGLDLGQILKEAARIVGGRGGGHDIAAGAEIPKIKKTLFVLEVDRITGEMLGNSK